MLQPLEQAKKTGPSYATDSPKVTCECCGRKGPSHRMINAILVIGSPGHESMSPFQCPAEEHWSCSPECWKAVAHACIDEHMFPLLTQKHHEVAGNDKI